MCGTVWVDANWVGVEPRDGRRGGRPPRSYHQVTEALGGPCPRILRCLRSQSRKLLLGGFRVNTDRAFKKKERDGEKKTQNRFLWKRNMDPTPIVEKFT